jgi:hypothetical protein
MIKDLLDEYNVPWIINEQRIFAFIPYMTPSGIQSSSKSGQIEDVTEWTVQQFKEVLL